MTPTLNFDNGNNACQSLRWLAEMARRGELTVERQGTKSGDGIVLHINPKESVPAKPMQIADQPQTEEVK